MGTNAGIQTGDLTVNELQSSYKAPTQPTLPTGLISILWKETDDINVLMFYSPNSKLKKKKNSKPIYFFTKYSLFKIDEKWFKLKNCCKSSFTLSTKQFFNNFLPSIVHKYKKQNAKEIKIALIIGKKQISIWAVKYIKITY